MVYIYIYIYIKESRKEKIGSVLIFMRGKFDLHIERRTKLLCTSEMETHVKF